MQVRRVVPAGTRTPPTGLALPPSVLSGGSLTPPPSAAAAAATAVTGAGAGAGVGGSSAAAPGAAATAPGSAAAADAAAAAAGAAPARLSAQLRSLRLSRDGSESTGGDSVDGGTASDSSGGAGGRRRSAAGGGGGGGAAAAAVPAAGSTGTPAGGVAGGGVATPTAGIAAAAPNSLTTPPPDAAAAATPPLTGENFNLRSVLLKAHAPGVLAVKYARAKRLLSLPSDAPLLQAVRIFATGIHRLSVVDSSTGELLGVLSQSVAVRYLWSRASSVSALMDRPVRSLGLGVEPVVSVRDSQTVISALATMHRDRLSSVAILDRQGGILGTLSLTDIKYIFAKREHSLLWTSCIAFVRYVREQDVPVPLPSTTSNSSGSGTPPPPPPGRRHVPVCVHPRGDAATDCVGKVCRHPCAPAVAAAGHAHAHGGAVADRPPPRHRPRGGAVARRPRCGDRVQVVRRHCGLRRGLSVGAYRDRAWQTPRRSSPSPPPFPPPRGGSPWDLSMCNRLFLCVGPPTAVRHGGATASLHGALVPDAGLAGQSPSSSCKPFSLLFFRSHEYSCTGGRYARAQPAMQVISIEWCLSGQREF